MTPASTYSYGSVHLLTHEYCSLPLCVRCHEFGIVSHMYIDTWLDGYHCKLAFGEQQALYVEILQIWAFIRSVMNISIKLVVDIS